MKDLCFGYCKDANKISGFITVFRKWNRELKAVISNKFCIFALAINFKPSCPIAISSFTNPTVI
ncbi:hypothetical protein [Flavobacterium sp.]|uniref:hypothetical protein n=1 Tax=Flavobacterium sp. TaxID=239 RepID=UPI003C5977B8